MKAIELSPKKNISGEIYVPSSKSITNRALVLASLAKGKSILKKVLFCDDTKHMIKALKMVGIKIEKKQDTLEIYGTGGKFQTAKKELFLGNSGTSLRFLTAIAPLIPGDTILTGDERMKERPIKELVEALKETGIKIDYLNKNGFPPIKVPYHEFDGGEINISGEVSSQYISALFFLATFGRKDTIIKIVGDLVSKPYVDMTISLLSKFGIKVENINYKKFRIKANQDFKPARLEIEGDASSSSYFLSFAAISEGTVKIKNVGSDSIQGDKNFAKALELMGCKVQYTKSTITVQGPKKLKAIKNINLKDMPDTALTLAVVAGLADGTTCIEGLETLKIKECDRLTALYTELKKCGIKTEITASSIKIYGGTLKSTDIETYNDHRIAMSFSLLSVLKEGIKILNPDCVNKTYPSFFKDLQKIKIKIIKHE